MTSHRARAAEIFELCCDREPADWPAFLDESCEGEPELRKEVESLLDAHRQATGFLDHDPLLLAGAESTGPPADDPLLGSSVGPYRLIRELGRGGMGVVFLAERADSQFEMQVAVKIIQDHLGEESSARFQRERQLLATLQHPHIARLHDGGIASDGRPYLVMEYVDGDQISDYCRNNNLTPRQRIELVLQVCEAVDHAHRNLVIHRDLKPGNLLVDGNGNVKLLDFGIATILGEPQQSGTGDSSRSDSLRLTPRYASPEQRRVEPVTTASDVYSLGVVLFELLVDGQPTRRPSTVARELVAAVPHGEAPGSLAARGFLALPSTLRRDLDAILMRALDSQPDRRYATAREFGDDLRRCLAHRPVLARPPAASYLAAQFVRRNPITVLAAVLALVSLVGGLVVSQRARADESTQRHRAEQLFRSSLDLNVAFFDRYIDRIRQLPGATRLTAEMLEQVVGNLEMLREESGDDPGTRHQLALAYFRLGDVQSNPNSANLGDRAAGRDTFGKSLQIAKGLCEGEPDSEVYLSLHVLALHRLGGLDIAESRMDSARQRFQEALAVLEQSPVKGAVLDTRRAALERLGQIEGLTGHHQEALEYFQMAFEDAVSDQDRNPDANHDGVIASLHARVGTAYLRLERTDEAIEEFDQTLDLVEGLIDEDPDNIEHRNAEVMALDYRSRAMLSLGHFDLAEEDLRRAQGTLEALRDADEHNLQLYLLSANIAFNLGDRFRMEAEELDASDARLEDLWQSALAAYQDSLRHAQTLVQRGARGVETTYPARCQAQVRLCEEALRGIQQCP